MDAPEAGFRDCGGRRLFYLRRRGALPARRRVLIAPPFAEELNKCRRLLSLTACALAAAGCDVLLPDLSGTGDSAGDFGETGWSDWIAEWRAFATWHAASAAHAEPAVLAVRSGALLLQGGLPPALAGARVVLWQPVLDGKRFMQQFLRLRVMAERISGGRETLADLERMLSGGVVVEVGGYGLSAALAEGLVAARLEPADLALAAAVESFEFKTGAPALSLPLQQFHTALEGAGVVSALSCVCAEQFWTTQEICAPAAAIEATVGAFAEAPADVAA